jgi:hypothetical protein
MGCSQPHLLIGAPGVEHRRTGSFIIGRISRRDRQPVLKRGRRDDEIGLGKSVPCFATIFNQEPPLEHDVFRNRQNALVEHGSYLVRQPIAQLGALSRISDQFNAEPDFRERHRADEETIKRLRCDEGDDFRLGSGSPQLGENIRIDQPARHRVTSRTGMEVRAGSISMSR